MIRLFLSLINVSRMMDLLNLFDRNPLFHFRSQQAKFDGLRDKIVHPLPAKHLFRSFHCICSKGYDRHIIIFGMKTPDNMRGLHSVQFRHHMIHKNNVVMKSGYFIHSRFSARYRINFHLQRLHNAFRHSQIHRVIIHDQNIGIGSYKIKFLFIRIVVKMEFLPVQYHGNRQCK